MSIPFILLIVTIVALGVLAAVLIISRLRRSSTDDLPIPDLDVEAVDYTSLPVEEAPPGLAEKIERLPAAVKVGIPVGLLVLVVLVVGAIVWPESEPIFEPTPTPIPMIEITRAVAVRSTRPGVNAEIAIRANTTLASGTVVTAELRADNEPFPWYDLTSARTTVQTNTVEMTLIRSFESGAPQLIPVIGPDAVNYEVILHADSTPPMSATRQLEISSFIAITVTPSPMIEPTATDIITDEVEINDIPDENGIEPTPTFTPIPEPSGVSVVVARGGRLRSSPEIVDTNVVDDAGVVAGDMVFAIERTADGWYRIQNPRNNLDGWVGQSLLTLNDAIIAQVPIVGGAPEPPPPPPEEPAPPPEPTDTPIPEAPPEEPAPPPEPPDTPTGALIGNVAHGGNVREQPANLQSRVLDQINAGETVQLIGKVPDSSWYHVTTERNVTGWVSVTLLRIDAEIAAQVPVEEGALPPPPPEPASGVVALVKQGGAPLYEQATEQSPIVATVEEATELRVLRRTPNGRWYQVQQQTPPATIGWVSIDAVALQPGGVAALTQVPAWDSAQVAVAPTEEPTEEPTITPTPAPTETPDPAIISSVPPLDSARCPDTHPIKGTTDGASNRLYLLPGPAYDETIPEICFANDGAAQEAGYRLFVPGNDY